MRGPALHPSPPSPALFRTAVKDAPAGTDTTVTAIEDTDYIFTAANFGFTDPIDGTDSLLGVKITTLESTGALQWYNGSAWVDVTAGQTISATDIGLNYLRFTPVANANGATYDSFTFQVQDDGGTANSGVDLDASPNTMTIDVTADRKSVA